MSRRRRRRRPRTAADPGAAPAVEDDGVFELHGVRWTPDDAGPAGARIGLELARAARTVSTNPTEKEH